MRHDSGRTGFNPDVGSFRPPIVLLDSFQLGSSNDPLFLNNIITDEERIYVQGLNQLWGIDKEDLSKRWHYDDCSSDPMNPCLIPYMGLGATNLVILKQRLVFPDFGYEVAVINPADGSELWSKFLGPDFADIAVQGDNIFLLTTENFENKLTKLTIGGSQLFKESTRASAHRQ